jgi:WD40 repeat protein
MRGWVLAIGLVCVIPCVPGKVRAEPVEPDDASKMPLGARARLWTIPDGDRGRRVADLPIDEPSVSAVAFCPRGKLLAYTATRIELMDRTSNGYLRYRGHVTIYLCDASGGKEVRRFERHGASIHSLVFSSDGKRLAAIDEMGRWIDVWNVITAEALFQGPIPLDVGPCSTLWGQAMTFLPGGRELCTGNGRNLHILDVDAAKELRRFRHQENDLVLNTSALAFSENGEWGAIATDKISLCSIATGKRLRELHGPLHCVYCMAFSPDRKTLAAGDDRALHIWHVSTGQLRCSVPQSGRVYRLAYSPDGRTLALTVGKEILLWEVNTGKRRGRIIGHTGNTACLAFAPDGRMLASGGEDMSCILWDLREVALKGASRPAVWKNQDLDALWASLADEDAAKAYQGIWRMVSTPVQTIPYLRRHVQPVAAADRRRLAGLIADLESARFEVRQQAVSELEQFAELAAPALQEALASGPTLETRLRLDQLLTRLTGTVTTPEAIRVVRAVEVLEQIGTAEAKQLLQVLAQGAAEARLTQEAKLALERLGNRHVLAP